MKLKTPNIKPVGILWAIGLYAIRDGPWPGTKRSVAHVVNVRSYAQEVTESKVSDDSLARALKEFPTSAGWKDHQALPVRIGHTLIIQD